MELMAVIKSLEVISTEYMGEKINVLSDSAYVINGINNMWYDNWRRNGWVTSKGTPVLNKDLWLALIDSLIHLGCLLPAKRMLLKQSNGMVFRHIKGHTGDMYHDLVDNEARMRATEIREKAEERAV
jgi:ribonuclease HI